MILIGYFTSAEGSFLIKIIKAKTKLGEALRLVFQLVQHARDEKKMKSLNISVVVIYIKAMMLLLYIK